MKLEIVIPTDLSEITLGQYQRFLKIEGDEEFRSHKMVEIFCGVNLKQVSQLKYNHVQEIVQVISDMFEQKPNLTMRWSHNGVEYGFIPNLEDITLGEYSDLDELMQDFQTMHRAMAVLFRPVQQKFKNLYTIEPYETSTKYAEVMKDMPMNVAFGALLFMYRLGIELCKHSLRSLAEEVKPRTIQQNPGSLNDGDGTQSSTHLHMVMHSGLNRLLALMSSLPSITPSLNMRSRSSKASN